MPKLLTKSKYMNGLESDNLLWRAVNDPSSLPEHDEKTLARFEAGRVVESYAHQLFPEAEDLSDLSFSENIERTRELLSLGYTLFEAGFLNGKLYTRSDIIIPHGNKEVDIIEIKSSTGAKKDHHHDLSFQKEVLEREGYKIRKCFVLHINNAYVKDGDIIVEEFLKYTDVTHEAFEESGGIEERITHMLDIMDRSECPPIKAEDIMNINHNKFLIEEFTSDLPQDNIFNIMNMRRDKIYELWSSGYRRILEVPSEYLNPKQEIQKDCAISGSDHVDKTSIRKFIDSLTYPIYHLDFETFQTSVPRIDGTRPYQQIPFQYSLHIENDDGAIEHKEFLFDGEGDPRKRFIESLIPELPGEDDPGVILAYNDRFEKMILRSIARDLPEYAEKVSFILPRFKDLQDPFKKMFFYSNGQKGSASIKKVLPIFSDISYSSLDIGKGDDAADAFLSILEDRCDNIEKTRRDLLEYCKLDTYSMVILLKGLKDRL